MRQEIIGDTAHSRFCRRAPLDRAKAGAWSRRSRGLCPVDVADLGALGSGRFNLHDVHVAGLTLALSRRYTLAWSALALAVLVKPLPVVVAPLLLAGSSETRWSLRLFCRTGVCSPHCLRRRAAVCANGHPPGCHALASNRIRGTGHSLTDATSVNGYNFWTLAWPVTSDSAVVLALTLHTWRWLAFSAILFVTTWTFFQRLAQQHDRVVQGKLTARAWFIVLVAVFLFLTRMHERYILFSLALAPLMWFCGRWERRSAITLISTFTICVTLVLGFYEHGWLREIPAVTHLLSLINLAAFAAVAASFFAARRTNRESTAI
jgi:hypothetical protein